MKKVKEIGKYSNLNDFLGFFNDDGTLKEGLIFKILSFKDKRYFKKEDEFIIQTKDLFLKNNKTERNVRIDNFYFLTFDKNNNTKDGLFTSIEVWEE